MLAVVGVVVALVSGLADVIGISFEDASDEEFGWIQIAGLAVGVVIAVVGVALALSVRDHAAEDRPPPGPSQS